MMHQFIILLLFSFPAYAENPEDSAKSCTQKKMSAKICCGNILDDQDGIEQCAPTMLSFRSDASPREEKQPTQPKEQSQSRTPPANNYSQPRSRFPAGMAHAPVPDDSFSSRSAAIQSLKSGKRQEVCPGSDRNTPHLLGTMCGTREPILTVLPTVF